MILKAAIAVLITMTSAMSWACPRKDILVSFQEEQPVDFGFREKPILGEMSQEVFDEALDKVEEIYKEYLSLAGINFYVKRDYESDYQNAHPGREDDDWFIEMYGGYFRNKAYETYEMVALVGCHEVGHHLGETAYYPSLEWSWASAEGQSDYFSTLKCMRKVFADDDNIKWVKDYPLEIPETVTKQCNKVWKTDEDVAICVRSSMAGFQRRFSSDSKVSFDTPITTPVSKTAIYHPSPQCRLDTNFQGALCGVDEDVPHSQGDEKQGNCNAGEFEVGIRPVCWYKASEEQESN